MKLGRDGVTQLEDDEEDTTVAPIDPNESETDEQKEARLAAEAEAAAGNETDEEKAARIEAERVAAEAAADPDEVVVTIGEGTPPSDEEDDSKAPAWVRQLRKDHRELARRNRELEAEKAARESGHQPATVGEKPKLQDFDFDTDKFGTALEAWHERKRLADETKAKQDKEANDAKAAWQATLATYGEAKAKLKVKDADEAEAVAQEHLSTTQQGVILAGAENPALLIYALGKNPKKAKELAAIKDPVKFAFAVAKLETQVKATPRKAPPAPETPLKGGASKAGGVDSHLEKLRADAEKTGDFSKVTAYRREKRQKAAA